jgi:hypothetical protein
MNKQKEIDRGEGLTPPGPLSGSISTMKVAVRPPDIPTMDRVSDLVGRLKKKGEEIPPGSNLCIRVIDGFIQFKLLTDGIIPPSSVLRVIEHDPSRGTFMVSGEGRADIVTEMAWYSFRAMPDYHVLLFIDKGEEKVNKREHKGTGVERHNRIEEMLDLAKKLNEEETAERFGYKILKSRTLEDVSRISLKEAIGDQLKSQ